MIWRSVVGKLWLTIIGLVTAVLLVLVLLLIQFLDDFYANQQEQTLTQLSQRLAKMVEDNGGRPTMEAQRHILQMSKELLPAYDTGMVVLSKTNGGDGHLSLAPEYDSDALIENLLKHSDIKKVLQGREVKIRGSIGLDVKKNSGDTDKVPLFKSDVLAVAEPIRSGHEVIGAIVLYQELSQLRETTDRTKELVFYAALIGIFLTTIFAFFLSSRISQPLMQMKHAADKIVKGNFNYRVPIRTHDEIGDLAKTFNHMGSRLENTIHALSQEKEQLSSVLRSMSDAVITVNATGNVIITNPPAENLLKMWSDESSREDGQVEKRQLPKPLKGTFDQVVRSEQEYATDLLVHGRTWAVVMAPLYAREQVRGAVAVLRDVTEERRLDKLRKDFVANVSHELRTPLAMLQGYSEALLDDIAQSPEDRKELVQIIHDESLRMIRLVKELLDLARMESGSIQITPDNVVMQELGKRVVRKFHGLAQEEGIRIEAEFPTHPVYGWIDVDRMEQVLTNLIDNAIRHTPAGGTVTLSMAKTTNGVLLQVRDTGSGIPAQDLPFIFERFYKADKARTRNTSGTGLGLSIAKHIVDEHNGTITVESEEGKGTVFTIRLPGKFS